MRGEAPSRLSADEAVRIIRELGSETGRIVIVAHAKSRQAERRITRRQIELCIQKGVVAEGPFRNMHGHWQVTLERRAAGEGIACAVAIEWKTRLIVVTVFRRGS